MKKTAANKVKLGVFILIGLCLLGAGIYMIGKSKQMFAKNITLNALFRDVSGLQPGNNIRFAGINVGIVEDISIVNDTQVLVTMTIDEETQKFIRNDATVIIGSDGLMGNKVINVNAGSPENPVAKDGQRLRTLVPLSMDDMMKKAKVSVDNVAVLSDHLAGIFANIRSGNGTIGKIFMDESLANGLNSTMASVQKGAQGFAENMEAVQSSFLLRGYFKKKDKENGIEEEPEENSREAKREVKKAEKAEKKAQKAADKEEKEAAKDSTIISVVPASGR